MKKILIDSVCEKINEIKDLDTFVSDYKEFSIPKKHGGFRIIDAPSDSLKKFQHDIADMLSLTDLDMLYISPYAEGFRKGHSTYTNSINHVNKKYLLNFDLKDFFPSITYDMVANTFKIDLATTEENAKLIAKVFTYKGYLPQGGPYSPLISNLVCFSMDRKIERFCQKFSALYTRYADDISISWNTANAKCFYNFSEKNISKYLINIIESSGFSINKKKTFLSKPGGHKEVTGIIVDKKPNAPKDYYYRLRSILNDCIKHGNMEACKHYFEKRSIPFDKSKLPQFLSVIKGMMAYYSMIRKNDDSNNSRYNNLAKKANTVLGKNVFVVYEDMDELIQKAEQGDKEAQYKLGTKLYFSGLNKRLSKADYWLKISAIGGFEPAIHELIKYNKLFDTPQEKIRWISRASFYNDVTKAKIIYQTYEKNKDSLSEEDCFKIVKASYDRGEFELIHILGIMYAMGNGCECDLALARKMFEEGAKRYNYICKMILMNYDYVVGDKANALKLANNIVSEYKEVNELSKGEQYKYFINKGYTYYKDGLYNLNKAYNHAINYVNLETLYNTNIDDDNANDIYEIEEKLNNNILRYDYCGIVSLGLLKYYLNKTDWKLNIARPISYIHNVKKYYDLLPDEYKNIFNEYEKIVDEEMNKNKKDVNTSVVYYSLGNPCKKTCKSESNEKNEVFSFDSNDLPF